MGYPYVNTGKGCRRRMTQVEWLKKHYVVRVGHRAEYVSPSKKDATFIAKKYRLDGMKRVSISKPKKNWKNKASSRCTGPKMSRRRKYARTRRSR